MLNKWSEYKLGDVASFVNGYAFKPTDWSTQGLPIVRIQNLNDKDAEFNYYDGEHKSKYEINNGDILISWSASLGVYKWLRGKALLNQHIFKVVFDKIDIDKDFFVYLINIELHQILKNVHGSTMKHITKKRFTNLKVTLPPLQTQKKIVEVLDKAQELIDLRKKQIELLDELIKSVFYDMFGDPVVNPKGWEVKKVIDECDCIVPARDKPKSFTGDIPWINISDLNLDGYTNYSKSGLGLTIEEIQYVKRKIIPPNSVLMSCVGDLGVTSINDKEIVINQQLHSFQCGDNVNPIYLRYMIPMRKDYMYKMATSTTVPYMNKTKCNNIPLMLPPLELQNKFAEKVRKIYRQKDLMQLSIEEMENNFNSLMQKAFKGELYN